MTRENENAVPGGQPGHGAKQASSQDDFPPSKAGTQRLKLLAYLKRHGHISTIEARSILRIMSVAARIWELKNRAGHRIVTLRDRRKVAHYHLMPGQDVGGTDG